VLTFNSSISDVYVSDTENDGEVLIEFLVNDGEIPGSALLQSLADYLQSQNIRPLTDHVTVQAPAEVSFDINVTYYINRSASSRATTIQADVATAVSEYAKWQRARIGRDINPDKLVSMMLAAGAKRVIVTSPGYTSIPNTSVAKVNSITATYGGLEDD
jgi:phage-related baseplate assembly protein